jgi:CHAD domain-containing protein
MALDAERLRKGIRGLRRSLRRGVDWRLAESVHDLRTGSRRVEAVAHALGLGKEHGFCKRMLKDLEPVRKLAGRVRDMDVLIGYAAGLGMAGKDDGVVLLLEELGGRRLDGAEELKDAVGEARGGLRRRLKRLGELVEESLDDEVEGAEWRGRAVAAALGIAEELKDWGKLGAGNLHGFRLKVKELRYILEMSEETVDAEFTGRLGEVKDAIGEWHDWRELGVVAEDVLEAGSGVGKRVKVETGVRYKKAVGLANGLRREFLGGVPGDGKVRRSRPGKAVVEAAGRLGGDRLG